MTRGALVVVLLGLLACGACESDDALTGAVLDLDGRALHLRLEPERQPASGAVMPTRSRQVAVATATTVLLTSLAREDRRLGRRLSHSAPLLAAVAFAAAGCGSPLDRTKFTGVAAAAAALQADVRASGGGGSNVDRLQAELAAAVRVLATRVDVDEEETALTVYRAASDAYTAFVRFRALDLETANGRLMLHGTVLEMAKRLGLTIETVGGVSVTDSGAAWKTALAEAERHLADATRMVRGG